MNEDSFETLLAEWCQKLDEAGFKDCESRTRKTWQLKKFARVFKKDEVERLELRREYFDQVTIAFEFCPPSDQLTFDIVRHYADGKKFVEIQKLLHKKVSRMTIYRKLRGWLKNNIGRS